MARLKSRTGRVAQLPGDLSVGDQVVHDDDHEYMDIQLEVHDADGNPFEVVHPEDDDWEDVPDEEDTEFSDDFDDLTTNGKYWTASKR